MRFNILTNAYRKIVTSILILAVLTPAALASFPQKAEAGFSNCTVSFIGGRTASKGTAAAAGATSVPVVSLGSVYADGVSSGESESTFLRDCIETNLATAIAKMLLAQMTNDIVNWINGGFNGSPAFISNPGRFFTNMADEVAGAFIEGSDLAFLCSPFRLQIQLSLALNYSYSYDRRVGCTLSDVINNVEGAFDDFESGGGWGGWLSITQNEQNNPYGSYLSASSQMGARIQGRENINLMKANWNGGFLSWDKCTKRDGSSYTDFGSSGSVSVGNKTINTDQDESRSIDDQCETQTPGKVIYGSLQDQLDLPNDQLGFADSLDKIFNALAFQLLKTGGEGILKAVGGGGNGLSSNGGSAAVYSRLSKEAAEAKKQAEAEASGHYNELNARDNGTNTTGSTTSKTLGQNVAGGKKATQSSTLSGYGPENLTDRNIKSSYGGDTERYAGSVTGFENDPWMEVDLGRTVRSIGQVMIYHRTNPGSFGAYENAGANPYIPFSIQILDKNRKLVWESKKPFSQKFDGPTEVVVPANKDGNIVRLQAKGFSRLEVTEIEVYEAIPPEITLRGADPMIIAKGTTFVDPGATAEDNIDGDITDKIKTTGANFSTQKNGKHTITYTVTNSRGMKTTVTREVTVVTSSEYNDLPN